MKAGMIFAFALLVVGCVGIGAWLVIAGHPWFGFFAMLIGAGAQLNHDD